MNSIKKCCEWRGLVKWALEKGERSLLDKCIWNWGRFGEKDELGSKFLCLNCQQQAIEWGELVGVDLTNQSLALAKVRENIQTGRLKCCQVVGLVDLNDPEHSVLYNQAVGLRFQFGVKLCFKCLVKINGILSTVNLKTQELK